MKLSQEELFLLSYIYEDGIDKKSVIRELSSINEEDNFLKNLIEQIGSLNGEDIKIVLEKGLESLSFSLDDIIQK